MRIATQSTSHRIISALVLASLCALLSFSGFQGATAADKPAAKPTAKHSKAGGRLPNYYGKVGLSAAQRKTIYAIQKKYLAQSQALIKQLLALRTKQHAEVEGVLTAEQAGRVKSLREAAAKKRAAARKKRPRKK